MKSILWFLVAFIVTFTSASNLRTKIVDIPDASDAPGIPDVPDVPQLNITIPDVQELNSSVLVPHHQYYNS